MPDGLTIKITVLQRRPESDSTRVLETPLHEHEDNSLRVEVTTNRRTAPTFASNTLFKYSQRKAQDRYKGKWSTDWYRAWQERPVICGPERERVVSRALLGTWKASSRPRPTQQPFGPGLPVGPHASVASQSRVQSNLNSFHDDKTNRRRQRPVPLSYGPVFGLYAPT